MKTPHTGLTVFMLLLALMPTPSEQAPSSASSLRADVVAVWQHQDLLVCSPYPACVFDDWDVWYSLWDETTGTWWTPVGQQAAPFARIEGDDVDPAVAFDTNGNAMAVWAHNQTQQYDIYYSSWNGASWSTPAVVDALAGDDTDPVVAFDNNGYALVLWVHEGVSIYYALWNGAAWTGHPVGQRIVNDWPNNFNSTSLPELAFTSTLSAAGGYTSHSAVAIWTQLYQDPVSRSRIFYSLWNGGAWSPSPPTLIPGQVENATLGDGPTSTYRNGLSSDLDGNAMATWGTASPDNPVYHSLWQGQAGTWTSAAAFAPKGTMPAIAYGPGGNATAVYSRSTAPGQVDLWESEYGQSVWSPSVLAADSSTWDRRPSAAWFGAKAVMVWWIEHPTFRNSEIFYSVLDSSGQSWSQASSLVGNIRPPFTLQSSGLQGNDRNPAVASSTGSPTMPAKRHDIAVVAITKTNPPATGGQMTLSATVANQGGFSESFNVTAFLNQTIIGTVAGISLGAGSSTIVSFDWNTAGMLPGTYVVRVVAVPVPGEDNLSNNMLGDGSVLVTSSISGCCGGGGGGFYRV